MATTFKTLRSKDVVSTRTMLHEAIPMTGTIVSGTYNDLNIKNYSHGIFQSVFDYPYLSSSANHIFDLTFGFASGSQLSGSGFLNNAKKQNIYNELAQILVGFDETGSVRQFDEDGDLTGGTKIKEAFFKTSAVLRSIRLILPPESMVFYMPITLLARSLRMPTQPHRPKPA
jgi:hypothetical protein